MIINRVDVDRFKETIDKAKKDPKSGGKKVMEVEGVWRADKTGPQFEAKIPTEHGGHIVMHSDETLILGGGGTAPNPVQYLIFGLIACYAATYAKWAAMDGVVLRGLRIRAVADMDFTKIFGLSQNPILEHLKWEMIIDTDADITTLNRLNALSKERCPGYYCITHEIFPEITIRKAGH
ncbi:MAG TPA: OsmC family protein [Candidatus Methanoperedenaceae archaeon]|nr:OsmC family protein [Candidatus Methanoperedenaceae archaeon]